MVETASGLVINLKTAKALGVETPANAACADKGRDLRRICCSAICRLLARSVSAASSLLRLLPEVKRPALLRCGNGEK
jgi:hypothetical protein